MRDNLLILRGIASLVVVFGHMTGYPSGWIAVWLFFMLSSFLLTKGFIDRRFKNVRAFYLGRARRLLPTYFFVQITVIGLTAAGLLIPLVPFFPSRELAVLLALPNTLPIPALHSLNSPVWSVILEIHFILLLPWIVRPKALPWLLVAWIAFVAYLALRDVKIWTEAWYSSHAYNAGFFLLGMLAAFAKKRPSVIAIPVAAIAWTAAEILFHSEGLDIALRYAPAFLGPAFFFLLVGMDTTYQRPLPRNYREMLTLHPMESIGVISYSMYLAHKVLALNVLHHIGSGALQIAFTLAVVLVVSAVIYVEIEARFRKV